MPRLVDVVIAVHDAGRPIARAVSSVFASGLDEDALRVTVVCHNIDRERIAAALGPDLTARVRLLELNDRIRSAAGPFNHGIDAADAAFVSIMGSDDMIAPGALKAWTDLAARHELDVVLPVQRHASGAVVRTPPVRFRRIAPLDVLDDRLIYRTAPIGILRRALLDRERLRLTPGVETGEDQAFSVRLYLSGARIGYASGLPAYVIGDDGHEHITLARRPVAAEFEALLLMIGDPWFIDQPLAVRRAVAVKHVRIHVFSYLARRLEPGVWTHDERREIVDLIARLERAAPGFRAHLSRADIRALSALADDATPLDGVRDLVRARQRFGTPRTILPARWSALLASDSPLRFMAASALMS